MSNLYYGPCLHSERISRIANIYVSLLEEKCHARMQKIRFEFFVFRLEIGTPLHTGPPHKSVGPVASSMFGSLIKKNRF